MSARPHTVLVVDDEVEVVESLRRTLRREAYELVTTTSPLEALALMQKGGVDLLLADIDMPEMSGIELVRRVHKEHPTIVRVLLTGDASLESALEAINEGEVHRYLTKPWQKDTLRQTLRSALERLDELRRVASASQRVSARERLLQELEVEHPGIRHVEREGDAYVLDEARVRAAAERAPRALRDLLDPEATVQPHQSDGTTRRSG
jgi:two-component system probable response regulator PhcQ